MRLLSRVNRNLSSRDSTLRTLVAINGAISAPSLTGAGSSWILTSGLKFEIEVRKQPDTEIVESKDWK